MASAQRRRNRTPRNSSDLSSNGNRLLAALDSASQARLSPLLRLESLEQRQPIWEPNQPIPTVYFPVDCVVSILAVTPDGAAVEIGTIGNEGIAGLPVFLGADAAPGRSIVQVPGTAHALDAEAFRLEARRDGPLRELLHRYTLSFMTQVSQSVVCNQAHTAERRLARWLLSVQDRLGRYEFPLTQEFMAQMLGVRRATVTEAAGALQRQKLIRYRRAVITVLDREGLEEAACDCDSIIREEFKRMMGVAAG